MSFHPNDIARRTRTSSITLVVFFFALLSAFFRAQVLQSETYRRQSQENRLREIPLPAPRGIIYDRKGKIIAENLPAYSVSITAPSVDSLRAAPLLPVGSASRQVHQLSHLGSLRSLGGPACFDRGSLIYYGVKPERLAGASGKRTVISGGLRRSDP